MFSNDETREIKKRKKVSPPPLDSPSEVSFHNPISIYIGLRLLLLMKSALGLEAMLAYMERYIGAFDAKHYDLKKSVDKALIQVNLVKLYRDADKMPD